MRVLGKTLIVLAVLLLVAFLALLGLAFFASTGNPEALGWTMIFGSLFVLPVLLCVAVLALVGAVLVTSKAKGKPKSQHDPQKYLVMPDGSRVLRIGETPELPSVQPKSAKRSAGFNDPLRTAILDKSSAGSRRSLGPIVIALRLLAVALFAWLFLPDMFMHIKYGHMMGISVSQIGLILLPGFIISAIIPLILWLVSNLIKQARWDDRADGAPA